MFIRQERSLREFIIFYPVISTIVIINFILWYFTDVSGTTIGQLLLNMGIGNNFLVDQGEYWRLLTPIFLHSGLRHVLFNSFALVIFGPALEQMFGKVKFVLFYLMAGVIGNLGTFIFGPEVYYHLGASGAVYGLFGIYLYMIFFRKDLINQQDQQIVMIITMLGFFMTIIRPNINIYAHLFGYVSGLFLAPIFLARAISFSNWRNLERIKREQDPDVINFDPHRWQKKRIPSQLKKNLLWIVLGILIIFALIGRFL